MNHGANNRNGLALVFFDADSYIRVRHQAVRFQHLRDFLLGLHFRQTGDMQAHRKQRNADRAGLADTDFAAQFFHVKNVNTEEVPGTDHVVMRHRPQSGGKLTNAVIDLLWGFENGLAAANLRAASRRQRQQCEQGSR